MEKMVEMNYKEFEELYKTGKNIKSLLGDIALKMANQAGNRSAKLNIKFNPMTNKMDFETKDYNFGTDDEGGYLVADSYANEVIQYLRGASVVRGAGASIMPIPTGRMVFRKQATGATAYWVEEGNAITKSSGTYETYPLIPKKLAALSAVSNDLLRYSGSLAQMEIQNQLLMALAEKEEEGWFFGTGLTGIAKGFDAWVAAGNIIDATGKTAIEIIQESVSTLSAANCYRRPVWFMNPATKTAMEFYEGEQNTNGFLFPELSQNLLKGVPVYTTSVIPFTEGETNMYLVDMDKVVIGQGLNLSMEYFPNGAYYDGANTVSGISTDQSVFRLIEEVDMFVKYDTAICKVEGVTLGAPTA